ncbi:phosphoenolpyruvate carboxylase [Acinetobacter sp. B5B]|uniref:phosphoenolpyruvate carboxylase n=1 Tax=Acinetobacter baretiae TaxID=2605383 RepID=UPI0018C21DEA|nr:phosphoenolpyruvate carboxylase [Acinetobacter baretiae]MBF7681957.1 phosphoenolpyruvate carboxylase [Acinetobacter baretiae]MBF7685671.1 phosphoenolpyruvate carboxylase [Acinetobacter baretiae]
MAPNVDTPLREDVRLLGNLLGETIKKHVGEDLFNQVEQIRSLAKDASDGQLEAEKQLEALFLNLDDDAFLPITRAFTHFLNFANIAEQYHVVRSRREAEIAQQHTNPLQPLFDKLKQHDISQEQLFQQVCDLNIELVLTAHPTEVSRRTLIQKYDNINRCLETLDQKKLTPSQRTKTIENLKHLICSAWHTDEIRQQKPTPLDEAKWGFAVIEQTLWKAVPRFIRELGDLVDDKCGQRLPIDATPIRFASWMGGDRDGNPNVTHKVTQQVLWFSRWQATDLYLRDLESLRWELSIQECTSELREALGNAHAEPYREYLRATRERLLVTRQWLADKMQGKKTTDDDIRLIHHKNDLLDPLMLCYRSLNECNLAEIANGNLLDFIHRVHCFGIELLRLDIRQESGRHRQAISAITEYLGLGHFDTWTEQARQNFLLNELQNKRPLLPKVIHASEGDLINHPDVKEVFATMRTLAEQPKDSLGAYIISMAEYPSDVLAVLLLQKEAGIEDFLRVVPLFETLKDLDDAAHTMDALFNMQWYKQHIQGKHEVMIGYSDSAKDAGFMSANWAQYRAQEELTDVAKTHDVRLTLFHGRGGSISRGGAPTQQALYSQPPGSISGAIRVTEQGEMIRFKFGVEDIALQNLEIYTAATLEATLLPPPVPKQQWRDLMDQMTETSVKLYRQTVRENPHFVEYLRTVTPELELQMLPLGSRPAKRKVSGGIESLRAIPWVFAWTQIRLMLPAWLGTGAALDEVLDDNKKAQLDEMLEQWPYFKTLIDMLEMVLSKSDAEVAQYYEMRLTDNPNLHTLGQELRQRLQDAIDTLLRLIGESELLSQNEVLDQAMRVRKTYLMPLHLLQAELMRRRRDYLNHHQAEHSPVDHALMVSITGIAAGLRNTG